MGAFDYYPMKSGDCNYGAILPMRTKLYGLYTKARETARFNLEDLFIQYPTPTGIVPPLSYQYIYISNADREPDYFNRHLNLDYVLKPMYQCLELAKRFGLERLNSEISENWIGSLHSTNSFDINSCAYKGNNVIVACQWYAFEIREEGENFKVVWVDLGFVDLEAHSALSSDATTTLQLQSNPDGKIICDKRSFHF